MRHFLFSITVFLLAISPVFAVVNASSEASAIVITEAKGWLESAYIKWEPVADATSYEVYYKETAQADEAFIKIDGMLIREYADYLRADVVGLKAGNYIIRVIPVFDETADASLQVTTETIPVQAYVREGFAFSPNSKMKTSSGAYNDDGTLRAGAQVIYLTPQTATTVELNVVTNNKGGMTSCIGIAEILSARQKGYDLTPLAIRVIGNVTAANMSGQTNSSGYIEVKGKSGFNELNTTIEGVGDDATINGWGILVRNCANVEIRNLGVMQFPDDGVSLDTDNENIWVHHNDFFYGQNKGGDKSKGDGSLDSKKSGYVTISYNHFWDSGKCNLLGNGTESPTYLTYHHNWYDHSDSRHPRVRCHTVHVYNNYFDGNAKYGVGATMASSVFVENNYFRNCKYPILISQQGTDINGGSTGTFSGEAGGMIKAFGNYMTGATRFVDQSFSDTQFDAIVTASREETLPATYKALKGGATYNNFDTDASIMYTYNVHTPEEAKENVMQYAGRINGGDLKFTFSADDDKDYGVNPAITSALNDYKGSVLRIGFGDLLGGGGGGGTNPPGPKPEPEGDVTHNFTTQGKVSTFFTISGNLSDSKGTVSYAGLTLTQCLKIEGSTSIQFTTTEESTLTLVFNPSFNGSININSQSHTATAGILTLELQPDSYTITKGDVANLYYMSVKFKETSGMENARNPEVKVYPNPVTDYLYIQSATEIESVEILDLAGVQLFSGYNLDKVDMKTFHSGHYIVKIRTTEGLIQQLIIKK